MSTAVNEIIAHFERANEERHEPFRDTYRHPATGAEMENAVMIPVRLLRQLIADHSTGVDPSGIALQLNAWSPSIAMGYEVPAAAQTMNAAANLINQQSLQLAEAREIVHHFTYTGPYTGRPSDSDMQERGRAFIKATPAPK